MSGRHRAALGTFGMLVLFTVITVAAPADGRDQGDLGTVSPSNPVVEKTFPLVPGIYANQSPEGHFFAGFRPPTCRAANYCDALTFEIDYPDGFAEGNFFIVSVTLSWPNPSTKEDDGGNDMDLFLWGDAGAAAGGPASKCGSPKDSRCEHLYPELVRLADPDRTTGTDEDGNEIPPVFLTVVNDRGLNNGYTIRLEFTTFEFPDIEGFQPPDREASSRSGTGTSTASARPPSDDRLGAIEGPGPEVDETVLVPGPDGSLREVEMPVLAAGQNVERREEGSILTPVWWGVIAGIVVASAVALFVLHRRREAAERGS